MSLKLFISKQCPACTTARKKLIGMEYTTYDVGTVDGLAEASYYGILSTPVLIQVDRDEREIKRWGSDDIVSLDKEGKI